LKFVPTFTVQTLKVGEENKDQVICPRCLKVNDALSRYCDKCGAPLSLPIAIELEEKRAKFDEKIANIMEVFEDPEVRELIARKLSKK
jgi:predicted amidophosphoribosyltransferase